MLNTVINTPAPTILEDVTFVFSIEDINLIVVRCIFSDIEKQREVNRKLFVAKRRVKFFLTLMPLLLAPNFPTEFNYRIICKEKVRRTA